MIIGVTCHDDKMRASAIVCRNSMLANGVDMASIHQVDGHGRGAGYWRWMPATVLAYIEMAMQNGYDFVVYSDAGVEFVDKITHITSRMSEDDHVFLFGNNNNHVEWCKGDVLQALRWKGSDTDKQVQASVHVWRASNQAQEIAYKWNYACKIDWMIDDSPSAMPNHPSFKEHRHPQAVLTCIAHSYGIPLHWWPSDYGHYIKSKYPNDTYPHLFQHHWRRDHGVNEPNRPEWTQSQQEKIIKML